MIGRRWTISVVIGLVLSACSSTTPPAQRPPIGQQQPTLTPSASTAPAATQAAPPATITPAAPGETAMAVSDGPITPTMAELRLGGERYATLGDPNAPLTIVEFTDYG